MNTTQELSYIKFMKVFNIVGFVWLCSYLLDFNANDFRRQHTSILSSTSSILPTPELPPANGYALITGGAGFVGRHFAHRLCTTGWHITVVDNMMSESAIRPEQWPLHLRCPAGTLTFIQEDCRTYFLSPRSNRKWDLFIHLAAVVGGRLVIEGKPLLVADDLSIDAAAFQWAVDTTYKPQPSQTVYFSSSAAYPIRIQYKDSGILLQEGMINLHDTSKDIGFPDMSYGWAKLTGEYLAVLANQNNKLKVAVYRPMSGYGEDQHIAYPFPAILRRVIAGENPLPIWSNATRDFMYIEDIVDCVLDTKDSVNNGDAVNLGTGIATSFSELAVRMAKQVGYVPKVTIQEDKPAGVAYRVSDADTMVRLGCKRRTSLDQGIAIAMKFVKDPNALLNVDSLRSKGENPIFPKPKGSEQAGTDALSIIKTNPSKISTKRTKYSSFQCTSSSQTFPSWTLQHTHKDFPSANLERNRVCRFRNICWKNNEFVFYQNPDSSIPDYLKLSSFGHTLLHTSYIESPWIPKIIESKIPSSFTFLAENKTYLFNRNSFADNFGHLLHDDLFTALAAMNIFNTPHEQGQVVFTGCDSGFDETAINPYTNRPRKEVCLENYATYTPLVTGSSPINTHTEWKGKEFCIPQLITGHASGLSLRTLDLQRGVTLRQGRDAILGALNLENPVRPTKQNVMILSKRNGFQGSAAWNNLCEDASSVITQLNSSITIRCFDPVTQTVVQQIKEAQKSTVIIAEHGTVSYAALYAQDGAVLVSIGSTSLLKEPHVLLFTTHFHTMFMVAEQRNDLPGIIKAAILQAEENFDIL